MKEKSSQAFQTLAALKSFGLLDYTGAGDSRTAHLTEDARTFIRAQQQNIKDEILKRCALKPKAIAKYWKVWGSDRPPDPICLDQLVLEGGFTDSAAKLFLKVYDTTIGYAGLGEVDKISDDKGESPPDIEVNDLIQWESGGVLQFTQPKRVRAIQEHQGEQWVFIEDSQTGIPMNQVILEQKGSASPPPPGGGDVMPPTLPLAQQTGQGGNSGVGAEINPGEREFLRGQLSKDGAGYRILVSGDLGPKEINNLIRVLKTQRAILADEDDEEDR